MFVFTKSPPISARQRASSYYRIDEVRREDGLIDDCVAVIDLLALIFREEERFRQERPCLPEPVAGYDALTQYFARSRRS